jgi:hypothetical protein
VRKISSETFQALLQEPLTPEHRTLVKSFMEAQRKFGLLTKRKYVYFWTIHNKYLPAVELEYSDVAKVKVYSEPYANKTCIEYTNRKR